MKELVGPDKDLFEYGFYADAFCITTNGVLDKRGHAVMGKGNTLEAMQRWPELPRILGNKIKFWGNVPHLLGAITWPNQFNIEAKVGHGSHLWSFPTKTHWRHPSHLGLIEASAKHLVQAADENDYKVVVLPRPGCGLGKLNWSDVRRVLKPIFDKRFVIVSNVI